MNRNHLAAVFATVMLCACSSNKVKPADQLTTKPAPASIESTIASAPDWYMTATEGNKESIYVVGTGVSQDLGLSVEKAMLDAQAHLADRIAADIDSFTKSYKHDMGPKNDVLENTEQIVRKLVSEVRLSSGVVHNKKIIAERNAYRSYIQLRYPTPDILRAVQVSSKYAAPTAREDALAKELDERKEQLRKQSAPPSAPSIIQAEPISAALQPATQD